MVMSSKHRTSSFVTNQDEPQSSSENGPDSPFSGDDSRGTATATATIGPSPKKSRRSIQKRVVSVPIGDGDHGSRSKGEAYPPSDSWAWRKYGQKPIKGSPYPRGYYRCSSSKGCPARKQVERNRMDPTMLVITYACEHNHPIPTSKHHNHHHQQSTVTNVIPSTPSGTTSDDPVDSVSGELDPPSSPIQINLFCNPPHLEFVGDSLVMGNLEVEYSWISDVSFHIPSFVDPICDDTEVANFPLKEEDESLFGDLDELPECSAVFRRSQGNIERCTATVPICGSIG